MYGTNEQSEREWICKVYGAYHHISRPDLWMSEILLYVFQPTGRSIYTCHFFNDKSATVLSSTSTSVTTKQLCFKIISYQLMEAPKCLLATKLSSAALYQTWLLDNLANYFISMITDLVWDMYMINKTLIYTQTSQSEERHSGFYYVSKILRIEVSILFIGW